MKIAERFYSIQGEGRYAGTPAYFVRLSGCNFMCNWLKQDGTREFCDTLAVWKETKEEITPEDLAEKIDAELREKVGYSSFTHIVITGGEPLLQRFEVAILCSSLSAKGYFIELETNGSVLDEGIYSHFDQINWSPKFKSAGYGLEYYARTGALQFWLEKFDDLPVDMKIVIANEKDEVELCAWMRAFQAKAVRFKDRVFLMPVSNTRQEHQVNSEKLVELCKRLGFKYSPRLHLMLWDKVVGV